jgi:hypothetical protein
MDFNEIYYKNRFQATGLLASYIIILISFVLPLDTFLEKGIVNFSIRVILYLILILVWTIIWLFFKYHLPKFTGGKIGVLIAIDTESDKQKTRIKEDFVNAMGKINIQNNLNDTIEFINLQDFKAQRVKQIVKEYSESKHLQQNGNSANKRYLKLQKNMNFHFVIFGSLKEREDKENKYIFSIDGLVTHRILKPRLASNLQNDFISIFPKEINFYSNMEFHGFKFSSEYLYYAARFMIGTAAFMSGDAETAFKIHKGLLGTLETFKELPNYRYMKERLHKILSEELLLKAKYQSDIKGDKNAARELINQAEKMDPNNYSVYVSKSYFTFIWDKDIEEALKNCTLAEQYAHGNGNWIYNRAFLYFYSGKIEQGFQDYLRIKDNSFIDEQYLLRDIINFNEEYYMKNPDFILSLFILGFIYEHKLDNCPLALERYELFINEAVEDKYKILREFAKNNISSIKSAMRI